MRTIKVEPKNVLITNRWSFISPPHLWGFYGKHMLNYVRLYVYI